jgi:LmbE family N-acetylglucosaminyl deacetylase
MIQNFEIPVHARTEKLNFRIMKNDKPGRRKFFKSSATGLGVLMIPPVLQATRKTFELNSAEMPPQKKLNILCVGAHPGDPEFGCGGTMAKYSDAGNDVTFLYLTRGEAYDAAQSFAKSAELRTKEAEVSCKILKAKAVFAGQVDGNTELNKQKNEEMAKLILAQKPDIVFTHWPLDSHTDHQIAGLLTLTAWVRSGKQFDLYFYEVNTGSETMGFTPTDHVDITNVRERKKAAMFAHKTQSPEEVYNAYFKSMEDFRGLEISVKAAEGFIHFTTEDEKSHIKGL